MKIQILPFMVTISVIDILICIRVLTSSQMSIKMKTFKLPFKTYLLGWIQSHEIWYRYVCYCVQCERNLKRIKRWQKVYKVVTSQSRIQKVKYEKAFHRKVYTHVG